MPPVIDVLNQRFSPYITGHSTGENPMKKQTKKAPPTLKGTSIFLYTSSCCGAQAMKTPCVKVDKKTAETQGLGTFRCSICHKACKCGRTKNPLDKAGE